MSILVFSLILVESFQLSIIKYKVIYKLYFFILFYFVYYVESERK